MLAVPRPSLASSPFFGRSLDIGFAIAVTTARLACFATSPQPSPSLQPQASLLASAGELSRQARLPADIDPFTAWNVEADAWGGQLGDLAASPTQLGSSSPPAPADSMPKWQSTFDSKMREWTSAEPFTTQAPELLVEMLRAALDSANQEYSISCGGCSRAGMMHYLRPIRHYQQPPV